MTPPEATVPLDDDPYAQLENFLEQPIVLEDVRPQAGVETRPPAAAAPEPKTPEPGPSETGLSETIGRLEQFAQRLAARFEALEGKVEGASGQTLEALRRLGERMGSELAMLDKRAVNLELTMARLRSTTEALQQSLRKLSDDRPAEPLPTEAPPPAAPPPPTVAAPEPIPEPFSAPEPSPTPEPAAVPDALFTLEEEVPPEEDWDDVPPEDPPPPSPPWP